MPIIREIIFGAARRGASLKTLLELSGITETDLRNSELNVPFEQAQEIWNHAVTLTGDPLLGLHLGEDTNPGIVGLTGHLMQTSPDLKTAFIQVCSFNHVFTDMFFYQLKETRSEIILEYKPAARWEKLYPETAMQAVDQALSGTLNVFELLSGKRIIPIKIEFSTRSKKHETEYERVLGASVDYKSDGNRLWFNKEQMSQSVLGHDKKLFTVFSKLLTQQKRGLKKANPVTNEVRRLLQEIYQFKAPSLQEIARQLNVVPRTLQRQLENERTTYRELVVEMQQELSRELLIVGKSKVKSVSAMLGYSDVSSFRRAFKKWTNKSPKDFKKS